MKDDIVIVSAARTPVGAFNGAFANLPAHELGKVAIKAALERAGVEGGRVSEVIMGQILTAGQGQNPARQASIAAGIPVESPAWGVNQLCGSGLRAVALGYQAILNGDSDIVVAGGQESMSMAPHCQHLRNGVKMGDFEMVDTMIKDGLWDAFNGYHMGNTAENVAKQWQITRAAAGRVRGRLAEQGRSRDEGRQVQGRDRAGHDQDAARATSWSTPTNIRRPASRSKSIAKLRPAFDKEGTVTAANASGINDGAAAVVLMKASRGGQARQDAARAHRVVGARRRRSGDHGHRPDPGVARGAQEGRLEGRRPRPDRGQRGVRRAGLRGQQGPRLGHRQGQRQRRRDRHRPSDRRVRRARADHAAATRCRSATPRKASPRSASAAAWASRCAWSAESLLPSTASRRLRRWPGLSRPCTSLML